MENWISSVAPATGFPCRGPHFDLHGGVVEAGYRYHDTMLARLLALAPDYITVTICSSHGFHPDPTAGAIAVPKVL